MKNSNDLYIIQTGIDKTKHNLHFVVLNSGDIFLGDHEETNNLLDKLSEQMTMRKEINQGKFTFRNKTVNFFSSMRLQYEQWKKRFDDEEAQKNMNKLKKLRS